MIRGKAKPAHASSLCYGCPIIIFLLADKMKKLKAVLLIDDDYISTWLNKQILEELQLIECVECISDPVSALIYLAKVATTQDSKEQHYPDLIFLDLDMPGMKGFDFLQRLRETAGCDDLTKRTVLLTSSMKEEDMARAVDCGIYSYLVKPLTRTKAREIILSFLGQQVESARE